MMIYTCAVILYNNKSGIEEKNLDDSYHKTWNTFIDTLEYHKEIISNPWLE